jgi:energy-coupling factor transporter ATP-binding protein EcfA2
VPNLDPKELAGAIVRLNAWAQANATVDEPEIRRRLREHFDAELRDMPVVSIPLPPFERVNFQLAIEAHLDGGDREAELLGLPPMHGYRFGLAELASPPPRYAPLPEPAAPEYEDVSIGERRILCVGAGLWLIRDAGEPLALLLKRVEAGPRHAEFGLEAMARERPRAEQLLQSLRELMHEHNVYRARVLEFAAPQGPGTANLAVRSLPRVARDQIVLREGLLERVERHTAGFARHAAALRDAGRHIKRGLLLHGPPGTGKTLTVMYLAGLMPDRTVLVLTGGALGSVGTAFDIARRLAPAMVVLEDVDLVARERSAYVASTVLFELLNQMDGLEEDSDVISVLTTNRADLLEPALAARPGRIDLAVELPLPGPPERERLVELYGQGMRLALADRARLVAETEGASPAFIRELLRRAALLAAERGDGQVVDDELLAAALEELRVGGGELTQSLLGARPRAEGGSTASPGS